MKPRLLINIITPSPIAYKSWLMHRSRWWMNKWTDSDTSVSGGTIYRHWRMCFERLLQAFARWQPGILLIVIHNRYSFAANDTLIHCLSSSDSTVHPEKSASWELPRNSFLTCLFTDLEVSTRREKTAVWLHGCNKPWKDMQW